jgi:hypothetical protein
MTFSKKNRHTVSSQTHVKSVQIKYLDGCFTGRLEIGLKFV